MTFLWVSKSSGMFFRADVSEIGFGKPRRLDHFFPLSLIGSRDLMKRAKEAVAQMHEAAGFRPRTVPGLSLGARRSNDSFQVPSLP